MARNSGKKRPKTAQRPKAKSKKAPAKTARKTKAAVAERVEQPKKRVIRKLPDVFELTKTAWNVFWQNKQLFVLIGLVYGLLSVFLVHGISVNSGSSSLKSQFDKILHGNLDSVVAGLGIFTELIGSTGSSSTATSGAYQLFLVVIGSLAIIWALRQVMSGHKISVKDAYYKGMYPIIPFILVLIVIGIELLPLIIGSFIYSAMIDNGIALSFVEKFGSALIFFLLAFWSLYLLTSSIFALYIVTLNDMTPQAALKSAKQLVKGYRWVLVRKLFYLPVALIVTAAIIILPSILISPGFAELVFLILSMLALVAVHTYMYTLYRELLND